MGYINYGWPLKRAKKYKQSVMVYLGCIPVFIKQGYSNALKGMVPHSQCLLKENPKFLQNFRSKSYRPKENFCLIFAIAIQTWYSKVKTIVFHKKKFPKLKSKMQVSL